MLFVVIKEKHVSPPSLRQVQTALCPFPPLRPSGCCRASNRQLSLWVGRPIRLWCTLGWCGWWEATLSTTPTTTWSSSKQHQPVSAAVRLSVFLWLFWSSQLKFPTQFLFFHNSYNLESSTWDVVPVGNGPLYRYGHSLALYQVKQLPLLHFI